MGLEENPVPFSFIALFFFFLNYYDMTRLLRFCCCYFAVFVENRAPVLRMKLTETKRKRAV